MTLDGDYSYQLFKVSQEHFEKYPFDLSSDELEEVKRIAERKRHIENAVLASADAVRVAVPDSQVNEAVAQLRGRFADDDQFSAELIRIGISGEQLAASLERELKVEAVMEAVCRDAATVSDTDASLYYYMNLPKFQQPEVREARHILVTVNPDFPENRRSDALAKIASIARRLEKKPERFAEQAQKHSECPTALQGGYLGKVKKGILFAQVEAALFKLRAGQISDVVESEMGFHLVLCEKILPAGPVPLEDVLPKLKQKLLANEKRAYQKTWLNKVLATTLNQAQRRTVNG